MAEFLEAFDVERSGLLEALGHLEVVWERFRERQTLHVEGSDLSDSMIATELALVRNDLERTKFTIGVFGLIKRGKSTLLNALIGREVSSMHVTPETAVPVYVSYERTPGAAIHFADGSIRHVAVDEVSQFTSQKHNPTNELGVTHVEQGVPVPFLRNGTRLIDTPGLDDAAADDVYTERTLQELDVCDAGVVVFLSPPTVGATEIDFLEEVVSRDLKKTFLVCNMYPQHFHDKQTRRDVLNYVGGRIVEASRRAGQRGEVRVYPVCAYEAWQSRVHEDVDMWKRSGADRLMRDLEGFLSDVAGKEALVEAVERIEKAAAMAKNEVRIRQQLLVVDVSTEQTSASPPTVAEISLAQQARLSGRLGNEPQICGGHLGRTDHRRTCQQPCHSQRHRQDCPTNRRYDLPFYCLEHDTYSLSI